MSPLLLDKGWGRHSDCRLAGPQVRFAADAQAGGECLRAVREEGHCGSRQGTLRSGSKHTSTVLFKETLKCDSDLGWEFYLLIRYCTSDYLVQSNLKPSYWRFVNQDCSVQSGKSSRNQESQHLWGKVHQDRNICCCLSHIQKDLRWSKSH